MANRGGFQRESSLTWIVDSRIVDRPTDVGAFAMDGERRERPRDIGRRHRSSREARGTRVEVGVRARVVTVRNQRDAEGGRETERRRREEAERAIQRRLSLEREGVDDGVGVASARAERGVGGAASGYDAERARRGARRNVFGEVAE